MTRFPKFLIVASLFVTIVVGQAGAVEPSTLEIHTLSNRADLVSGGDVLVEIEPPPAPGSVVDLDGVDVTANFLLNSAGDYVGLVTGLAIGANQLTVTQPDGSGAAITIENHPIQGPIFAGPHLQPWDCTTEENGLGAPLDEDCNVDPIVDYHYISTSGGDYQAYDVDNPPNDVANTTTDSGDTVRHIVRRERGAINRGLYSFAYLSDPAIGMPDPREPQRGHDGRLYFDFGVSCNTNQTQGPMVGGLLNQARLSRGFATANGSLNVLGHHCNPILSAESAMMVKEKLVEQVGQLRYTMTHGASGGAIGALVISNAYPGIINGIIAEQMYADVYSNGMEVADCLWLETYFPKAAIPFTPTQIAAVDGHAPPYTSCAAWVGIFAPSGFPTTGCFSGSTLPTTSTPDERDYNPVMNPDGCRATVPDIQVNVLGRRDQDGFAQRPLDNVGVQYGLEAVNLPLTDPGKITFAQFLDLNAKIGGSDIDGVPQVARTRADPQASERASRSSLLNDGRGLAHVAIINLAWTSNFEIHTAYHAYAMEERLKALGLEDNHAIWHGGPGGTAFDTIDAWLSAVDAAGGIDPLTGMDPALIKATAPTSMPGAPLGATDTCWMDDRGWLAAGQRPLEHCADFVFGDARLQAGMPLTHDIIQCELKPIDPADYAGAVPPLTPIDLIALETVFPEGVCDYTVPGQGQVPSAQWLTYENGPGGVTLGPVPTSTRF